MNKLALGLLIGCFCVGQALAAQSANYKLPQNITDSGGRKSSSGNYVLQSKSGIVNQSGGSGTTAVLYPGFFFPLVFSVPNPPAFVKTGEFSLAIVTYNRESGVALTPTDKISARPKFKLVVTDKLGIDHHSTVVAFNNKEVINNNNRALFVDPTSPESTLISTLLYEPAELSPGTYTLRIDARDTQDRRLSKSYELTVDTGPAKVESLIVTPGTFSPSYPPVAGKGVTIAFSVSKDSDVNIVIFGPGGRGADWNRRITAHAGYNQIEFSGISDLSGQPLANGVYIIKIIGEGKELGKQYLVVFDERSRK